MEYKYKPTLENEIKEAVAIARDLNYSYSTIEKLKVAKSRTEITNILHKARMSMDDGIINKKKKK